MTERWDYSLINDIDPMDWDDFMEWADGAKEMYEKEAKARREANR